MSRLKSSEYQANRKILLQRGCCDRCGRRIGLEVHHKMPVVQGGTDEIENLELLCDICHSETHKTNRSLLTKIGQASARLGDIEFPLFSVMDLYLELRDSDIKTACDVLDIIDTLPQRGSYKPTDKEERAKIFWMIQGRDFPEGIDNE